jgi:hypothetical protein
VAGQAEGRPVKLAPCQCSRWPDSRCDRAADSEDLLCSVCRTGTDGEGVPLPVTGCSLAGKSRSDGVHVRADFGLMVGAMLDNAGMTREQVAALREGILKLGEAG